MSDKLIRLDKGSTRELRLNRPEIRNALDEELIQELTAAVRAAADDKAVRFVLLSGEGKSFCAGADINYMRRLAEYDHQDNLADARLLSGLYESISACSKPVVARVQGAAIGGGLGLVAAADLVVAAEGTKFGLTEARLGILPAVIAPFVLRRLGPGACRTLFLSTQIFTTEKAQRLGLVDEVAAPEELDAEVEVMLKELSLGGPLAQAACKRLLDEIGSLPLAEACKRTPEYIASQRATAEAKEGFAAYFEKRPTKWVDAFEEEG
ncbi:MAG TPA: enoyl-CoA hydratase-related protein [Candidatus Krumholzibacteria bacterium]|nr:enoyl-CoA hydratase-related protein [Candidatus Krumholzibacteria bacterium]